MPQLEKACKTIEDEVTLVPKDNTPAPRIKKESVWSEHKADLISIIAGAALFAAGMIAEHAMSAGTSVLLPIFLVGYLVLGWEVLWTSAKNISKGQVFERKLSDVRCNDCRVLHRRFCRRYGRNALLQDRRAV